jgi:hypothetical protein
MRDILNLCKILGESPSITKCGTKWVDRIKEEHELEAG